MSANWFSVYIFYGGNLDVVLTNLVHPFVNDYKNWFSDPHAWFFIRYGEEGKHIRLRMHTGKPIELSSILNEMASAFFNAESSHYDISPEIWAKKNYIKFEPYVPEVARYGGEKTIRLAERFFMKSSEMVLKNILNNASKKQNGFTEAIRHHFLLIFSCGYTISEIEQLCGAFINNWLKPLCNPLEDFASELDLWHHQLRKSFQKNEVVLTVGSSNFWNDINSRNLDSNWLLYLTFNRELMSDYFKAGLPKQTMHEVLNSLMHMTHNRLAIPNAEEPYLMYCTLRCLQYVLK